MLNPGLQRRALRFNVKVEDEITADKVCPCIAPCTERAANRLITAYDYLFPTSRRRKDKT